jgi:hypothetical protein
MEAGVNMETINETMIQRHLTGVAGNGGRDRPLLQPSNDRSSRRRSAYWIALLMVFLMAVSAGATSQGADFVIAVDVSGSMSSAIGRNDKRVRIAVVQESLRQYLPGLPSGSRLDLIAFNSGIVSEKEILLNNATERDQVLAWVDGLAEWARNNNKTYLWTTVRHALKTASRYLLENPNQSVTVRVLTDGEDNEGVTTLDSVLQEFLPLLDGKKVRSNLVLLGDLEFKTKLTLPEGAFEINTNSAWENLFPPVVLFVPGEPSIGEEVRLFENTTKSIYRDYEWQVDGTPVGKEKVLVWRFTEPRNYRVMLKVTGLQGTKTSTSIILKAKDLHKTVTPKPFWAQASTAAIPCLILLGAAAILIRRKRRKALRLLFHYWAERSPVCQTVVLTKADEAVKLTPAAPILITRAGKSQNLVVQPLEGTTLFDTNGAETPSRIVGDGVRITVKPSNSPMLAIAISIQKKPHRPAPASDEWDPQSESEVCGLHEPAGNASILNDHDEFDWGWDATEAVNRH